MGELWGAGCNEQECGAMSDPKIKYPSVTVSLEGVEGLAAYARVAQALRHAGASDAVVQMFREEVLPNRRLDYDHVLQACKCWVPCT